MFDLNDFQGTINSFYEKLKQTREEITDIKPDNGSWSLKEIIGHLVDSASNNHQRFLRLHDNDLQNFPSYDGERWVKIQKYNDISWTTLIDLWYSYNCLLIKVVENMDTRSLSNAWIIENDTFTLEWLVKDYFRHLKWHEDRFTERLESLSRDYRTMPRKIGILGGISHQSTLRYYELIHQIYYDRHGDYNYPEILIYSLNFRRFTDFEDTGDKDGYIRYIMQGINSLERAGADFIVMAANSPHAVFGEVEKQSTVPVLSIAEATAKKVKEEGMKRLLLLGIKFTMQASFYKDVCSKYQIEVVVPSGKEQDRINEIIFKELVLGVFKETSKNELLDVIRNYKVDGVILGCTELPLMINQEDVQVKLLDTLKIHVEVALDTSLSS
ncbi:MAG: amino acid racemase [Candidatus Odinarchaeota archaeon]